MGFDVIYTEGAQREEIERFIHDLKNKIPIEALTSGSTGKPKRISFSLDQAMVSAQKTVDFFQINTYSTVLLCLDINTIAAKMQIVRAFCARCLLICAPVSSNPLQELSLDFDFISMVPLQLQAAFENDQIKKLKKQSILIGGSPLSEELKQLILDHQLNVFESFGMTETLSHIALKRVASQNETFKCLPGIKIEQDNSGALIIHYDKVSSIPILTNDIVEIIDDDTFIWKGRKDFIINSGGYKLNPETIEKKINKILKRNVLVGKLKDNKLGEKMVLLIEGETIPLQKVNFKEMKPFEIPKYCCFVEKFTRLNTKIDRKTIMSNMDIYDWRSIL